MDVGALAIRGGSIYGDLSDVTGESMERAKNEEHDRLGRETLLPSF